MLPVDSTNHELTNGVVPPNSETEILNVTANVRYLCVRTLLVMNQALLLRRLIRRNLK